MDVVKSCCFVGMDVEAHLHQLFWDIWRLGKAISLGVELGSMQLILLKSFMTSYSRSSLSITFEPFLA